MKISKDTYLKLYIVGERRGNPEAWVGSGPRAIIVARSEEEALSFTDLSAVVEIRIDKPGVLMTTEGMHFND